MDSIEAYFNGERLQCVVGLIVSVVIVAFSVSFLFQQKVFFKGIAYVAIPLSALLIIICTGVIFRTSKDISRVTTFKEVTPEKIQSEEIPRMEKVMKSFGVIKKVELAFFIIGLGLIFISWRNDLLRGVAVGLLIMGASLYVFDHLAESRGEAYIQFLKSV
jgi:hypothetical protein